MRLIKYSIFIFLIWYTNVAKGQLQCTDTLYLCEGYNCLVVDSVHDIQDIFIVSDNASIASISTNNKEISGDTICFDVRVFKYYEGTASFAYTINDGFGNICWGIVVFETDELVLPEKCQSFINDNSDFCGNDGFVGSFPAIYEYCQGDSVYINVRNALNPSNPPNSKMSTDRISSSLGRVTTVDDYGFWMVWENAGEECLDFTTSKNGTCQNYRNYSVKVNPKEKLQIISDIEDGDTICIGEELNFRLGNQSIESVVWKLNDGREAKSYQVEWSFITPGQYSVIAYADELTTSTNSGVQTNLTCYCTAPDTINFVVKEGDVFDILCAAPICPSDSATYYASIECGSYAWNISPEGTILDGGGEGDSYVKVQWQDTVSGLIKLDLAECGVFCREEVEKVIPIISSTQTIVGEDIVCPNDIPIYEVNYIPGTQYTWSLKRNGKNSYVNIESEKPNVAYFYPYVNGDSAIYVLTVEYENCALGCSGTAQKTIVAKQEFSISTEGTNECIGNTGIIYNNKDDKLYWTITSPSGVVVSLQDTSIEIVYNEVGIYHIKAKDTSDLYCNDEIDMRILVSDVPTEPDSIIGPSAICLSEPSTYKIRDLSADQVSVWTMTDGAEANVYELEANEITYQWKSMAGPYEIAVKVKDRTLGCFSEGKMQSYSNSFSYEGPSKVCILDTVSYKLLGEIYDDVEWTISPKTSGAITSNTGNEITVVWLTTGIHNVKYEICGFTDSKDVTVGQYTPEYITYDSLICYTGTSTLKVGIGNNDSVSVYKDGFLVGQDSVLALGGGKYNILVKGANGCKSEDSIEIKTYRLDPPTVSSPETFNVFCPAIPYPIDIATATLPSNIKYQWYKDGTLMAGEIGKKITTQMVGDYKVEIVDENGCTALSNEYSLRVDCGGGGGSLNNLISFTNNYIQCSQLNLKIKPPTTSTSFDWIISRPSGLPWITKQGDDITHVFDEVGYYKVVISGNLGEQGFGTITIPVIPSYIPMDGCTGSPVLFENTSDMLFDSLQYEYSWDFGDVASGINNTSMDFDGTHVYSTPGTYTVTLSVHHPSSDCTTDFMQEIVIDDGGVLDILSPDTICLTDQAVDFSLLSSVGLREFSWKFQIGVSDTVAIFDINPTFTFPDTGVYRVSLQGINANGCQVSAEKDVVVGQVIYTEEITADVDFPKCETDAAVLTAPSAIHYSWSTSETTRSISTINEGNYQVCLTDQYGCEATFGILVNNNMLSQAKICARIYDENAVAHVVCDSISICSGNKITLFTQKKDNYKYKWSISNGNSAEISYFFNSLNTLAAGNYTVTVEITDLSNNCKVITEPFILNVNGLPIRPDAGLLKGGLCPGDTNLIGVISPDPDLTYIWEDGYIGISKVPFWGGNYGVYAVDSNKCKSPLDYVSVRNNPVPPVWLSGCHEVCFPDTYCFQYNNSLTYNLYKDGEWFKTLTKTSPEISFTEPGDYHLVVNNTAGCIVKTDILSLDPEPIDHDLKGIVFLDANENDFFDLGIDSLLGDVNVLLMLGNTILDSIRTKVDGSYDFSEFKSGDVYVTLDVGSLLPYYRGNKDSLIYFSNCDDSLIIDFPLIIKCVPTYDTMIFDICPGDSVTILGNVYKETTVDSIIIASFTGCDSITIVEVNTYLDPILDITETNSCFGMTDGAMAIENLGFGSLEYALGSPIGFSDTTEYSGLAAGDYILYVKTEQECITELPFTITSAPEITFDLVVDTTCHNEHSGRLNITDNPDSGFTYKLNNGGVFSNQKIYDNLPPGSYSIYALDTFGCEALKMVDVPSFEIPIISINTQDVCPGETGFVEISGAMYFSLNNVPNYIKDTILDNIDIGVTTLYFSYENGCKDTMSVAIKEVAHVNLLISSIGSCEGSDNGGIAIEVLQGEGVKTKLDISEEYDAKYDYTYISPGEHILYFIDSFGCEYSTPFTIESYNIPVFEIDGSGVCEGQSNGIISIFFTEDLSMRLDDALDWQKTTSFINLESGIHTVYAITDEGCIDSLDVFLPIFPEPQVTLGIQGSCENGNLGSILWSSDQDSLLATLDLQTNYDSSRVFSNLLADNYILHVLSNDNCRYDYPFEIPSHSLPQFEVEITPACNGQEHGELIVNTDSLGQLMLNDQIVEQNTFPLPSGTYNLSVISDEGCRNDTMITIPTFPELVIEYPPLASDCFTEPFTLMPLVLSFANELTYQWSTNDDSETLYVNESGIYDVLITDDCSESTHEWEVEFVEEDIFKPLEHLPNIFAPKGSEANQCFNPIHQFVGPIQYYKLMIFDRWGNQVFQATDRTACWDALFNGQYVEGGVYVYMVELTTELCGEPKQWRKVGEVTVLY